MSGELSPWKARHRRSSEADEDVEQDFGPVTWEELSNLRRNSVILFVSDLHPNKISEWTLRAEPGRETKYYTCVLCRRLQDRGRRENPPVTFGPAARILVRNGRFLVHPDYPKTPHICGFAENPLSDRAAVLARRAMIRARTEISEDGLTPKQKINQVIESFRTSEKYANLSDDEIAQMEAIVRGKAGSKGWSDSSCARSLYLNRRKLTSIKYGESRKIFECPIVGCDFLTTAVGMIDVHISETHKIADGDFEQMAYSKGPSRFMEDSEDVNYAVSNDSEPQSPSSIVEEDEEEYGPVASEGGHAGRAVSSVILFSSERFPNKISEWASKGTQSSGFDASRFYYCVLCRRVKEHGRRASPPVSYPPCARIVITNGRFVGHPDYPKIPHICDFENNPLADRDAVLARRPSLSMGMLPAESEASLARKRLAELSDLPVSFKRRVNADWEALEGASCSRDARGMSLVCPSGYQRIPKGSTVFDDDSPIEYVDATEIMSNEDDLGATCEIEERMAPGQIMTNMNQDRVPLRFDVKTKREPVDVDDVSVDDTVPKKLLCSIVGCDFSSTSMDIMDEHLMMHETLEEQSTSTALVPRKDERSPSKSGPGSERVPLRWNSRSGGRGRGRRSAAHSFGTQLRFDSPMDIGRHSPEIPTKVYGRVVYVSGTGLDREDVILHKSQAFPGRISEWQLVPTASDLFEFYECFLCRKKKRAGQRGADRQPAARICVRDGRFLTDPDLPEPPHICNFEVNPLSVGLAVLSRRKSVLRAGNGRNATNDLRRQMEVLERLEKKKAAEMADKRGAFFAAGKREVEQERMLSAEEPEDEEDEDDDISVGEVDVPIVPGQTIDKRTHEETEEFVECEGEESEQGVETAVDVEDESNGDTAVPEKSVQEMQREMKHYLKMLEGATQNLRYDQLHSGISALARLSSSLRCAAGATTTVAEAPLEKESDPDNVASATDGDDRLPEETPTHEDPHEENAPEE